MFVYIVDHLYLVAASYDVLSAVVEPDEEAAVAAAVVAEICAYHDVAEITPVAEESSAAAEPKASGGGIAGVYRLNILVGEEFRA